MSSGTGIFHIRDDKTLIEMIEQPYDTEALLQSLLVDHPSLLAVARSVLQHLVAGCWSSASSRGKRLVPTVQCGSVCA